jgi:transcriptional antiterminator RfaH
MSKLQDNPWRVIYTRGRFEKKVAAQLKERNIVIYLPLVKKLHQWSDRKKWIETPLFPNYLFLRADEIMLYEIVKIPGIVRSLYNAGIPVMISENRMKDIIRLVENSEHPEVEYDTMQIGSKVCIKSGPLRGMEGKLIQRKGKYKFSVELEAIHASVLIEIDLKHVVER